MAWYLVYTKSKEEIRAKLNLERQKFKVYVPMMPSQRDPRGGQVTGRPLFPRYLFLWLERRDAVDASGVKHTRGVVDFVKFGNSIAVVPEIVIASVRKSERFYQRGGEPQRKRICQSASSVSFGDTDAEFRQKRGDDRSVMLINRIHESLVREVSASR